MPPLVRLNREPSDSQSARSNRGAHRWSEVRRDTPEGARGPFVISAVHFRPFSQSLVESDESICVSTVWREPGQDRRQRVAFRCGVVPKILVTYQGDRRHDSSP